MLSTVHHKLKIPEALTFSSEDLLLFAYSQLADALSHSAPPTAGIQGTCDSGSSGTRNMC
jgi:hypothetical protein